MSFRESPPLVARLLLRMHSNILKTKSFSGNACVDKRLTATDDCVYNGQSYDVNTKWKMEVDGVMMECSCNSEAYLRCESVLRSSPVSSVSSDLVAKSNSCSYGVCL